MKTTAKFCKDCGKIMWDASPYVNVREATVLGISYGVYVGRGLERVYL